MKIKVIKNYIKPKKQIEELNDILSISRKTQCSQKFGLGSEHESAVEYIIPSWHCKDYLSQIS